MELKIGSIVEGKVKNITNFGAFVELEDGTVGLVHISEISNKFVNDIHEHVSEGQAVKVKILQPKNNKPEFSIKQALENKKVVKEKSIYERKNDSRKYSQKKDFEKRAPIDNFENMMSKFMKLSDDKLSDFNRKSDSGRGGRASRRGNNHSNS